jgi:hypothetical protein
VQKEIEGEGLDNLPAARSPTPRGHTVTTRTIRLVPHRPNGEPVLVDGLPAVLTFDLDVPEDFGDERLVALVKRTLEKALQDPTGRGD